MLTMKSLVDEHPRSLETIHVDLPRRRLWKLSSAVAITLGFPKSLIIH
jgi:hypothetical protein